MNFEINSDNYTDDDVELTSETDLGGIVIPKQTCEHVQYVELLERISKINNTECIDCESRHENWLCLSCGEIHCSRYINNHGEGHWLFTLLTDENHDIGHCLTISVQDLSVWCYPCRSYVKHIRLNPLIEHLETIKFGLVTTKENQNHSTAINKSIIKTKIDNPSIIIAVQDPLLLDELEKTDILSYCYTVKIRSASIDELVCLHSSDYVNMIVSAEKNHLNISKDYFNIEYDETSFSEARISAGITIDVIQNALKNHINSFIILTSPGHRAVRDHGNGTSIYNNVAIGIDSVLIEKPKSNERKRSFALMDSINGVDIQGATPIENAICHMIHVLSPAATIDYTITSKSSTITDKNNNKIGIKRVLIIDLTSEHGCGIQSIYNESDQVFYISIHPDNHQDESNYLECGKNKGIGYTMNIPLSSIDEIDDKDYITIINELILPVTNQFRPELIIVCVDFYIQNLTPLCYAWIIEQLTRISYSKVVVTLDGNLSCVTSRALYVQTVLSVLIGKLSSINNDKWKSNTRINNDVRQKINLVKQEHKQYWSCLA